MKITWTQSVELAGVESGPFITLIDGTDKRHYQTIDALLCDESIAPALDGVTLVPCADETGALYLSKLSRAFAMFGIPFNVADIFIVQYIEDDEDGPWLVLTNYLGFYERYKLIDSIVQTVCDMQCMVVVEMPHDDTGDAWKLMDNVRHDLELAGYLLWCKNAPINQ